MEIEKLSDGERTTVLAAVLLVDMAIDHLIAVERRVHFLGNRFIETMKLCSALADVCAEGDVSVQQAVAKFARDAYEQSQREAAKHAAQPQKRE